MSKTEIETTDDAPVGEDRRGMILDEASLLFATKGFHATSMKELAVATGLHKATLYHYFSSKEEIMRQILERGINELIAGAEAAVQEPTPTAQLEALLESHSRSFERRLSDVSVFLLERRSLDPVFFSSYLKRRREYEDFFIRVIREGQRTGEFREGSPGLLAFAILGIYNWMIQWFRPDGRLTMAEIHAELLQSALKSVLASSDATGG